MLEDVVWQFALWAAVLERLLLNFDGHQPQNWKRSPDRPLLSAVSCRLTRLPSCREFAGLSVWQSHTKVNTQKEETGFESWWALLWCFWRPPSLPGWFPLGFSFLGSDHTLNDSQQSVFHHERAPTQELERKQLTHSALCRAGKTARHFHFDFLLLPKFEGIVFLGAYAPGGMLFPLFVLDASVLLRHQLVLGW